MNVRRFLLPPVLVSFYAWLKFRARISPRSEVEWSENLRLGRGVNIASFCKIKTAGVLEIGAGTQIAPYCFITSHEGGLSIGKDCMIGPSVTIAANSYRYDDLDVPIRLQPQVSAGVRIGDNVWIASGCVVLDGADIGSGSIVTPNTVVSGKVPANSILQGNPGKVIFTRR